MVQRSQKDQACATRPRRDRQEPGPFLVGRVTWCCDTDSIPDPADVVAAPEVRLRGRRLPSAPDEDDVAEDDRKRTDLRTEVRAVLHLEVQVRHQRVARVPDSAICWPSRTRSPLLTRALPVLEVREHCVAPTANIEGMWLPVEGFCRLLPTGSSGWTSLTLTTVPSAGDSTGSPKPYQTFPRFGSPSCAAAFLVELHEVDGVAHDGSLVVGLMSVLRRREHRPLAGQRGVDGNRVGGVCRCAPFGWQGRLVPMATRTLVAICTWREG